MHHGLHSDEQVHHRFQQPKQKPKGKLKMEKTNAQTLLDKLTGNLKDSVKVDVEGVEFTFLRDNSAYDQMMNDITTDNKVTPIKDYLLAIVAREQKEDLLAIINVPGLAGLLAGKVNEVLVPKINITVKN